MTRDGQATAPVAPLAGEAADRSGQQRERRSRGERIHDQGDRGLLVVAGDRRHQVNSERLLGAEPRRQTPAAAATGRPPKPRSSAWPGGAATAITAAGMPTAFDPAAAWAATKAARNATAVSSRREQQVHQYPDPDPDEEDLEAFGTPVYQGSGLSVRALTAEELQRFLDAHADEPAELLGSGWAALDPPEHPPGGPRTPPAPIPAVSAEPVTGSHGSPGRSALVEYRRRRALELAGWTRGLAWRAPLVAAAGAVAQVLAAQGGLPRAGLTGVAVAALVGWRLRFRPSEQARSWQRGAHGERHTARLLRRLVRDGFVIFHDLAVPGSDVNVDHLVIGPTGVFVIDSKRWTGQVHQTANGLAWHNDYRVDRTLETGRWETETVSRLLGTRATALLCVHGAHVHGGGLHAQGVAIVPAGGLRDALGQDRVLSDADVQLLAAAARMRRRPAA